MRCQKYSSICAIACCVLLLASCTTTRIPVASKFCASDEVLIDANFEGGNFAHCSISDTNVATIDIRPEDAPPINESPWYAFRVSPRQATEASITMHFHDGYARYWPKISTDGTTWTEASVRDVHRSDDGMSMTLTLSLGEQALYVSGQELITTNFYYSWIRELAERGDVNTQLLGHSVEGRPLFVAKTSEKPEAIILIGRQHPPEITGALAMRTFVDTVLGDSELATTFRQRFCIVIIPLINPDGVAHGHWRHNVNGVDLNRDWGPFTQPETQSVARFLATEEFSDTRLRLMLDFHSTRVNTFYTQLPSETNYAFDFATVWLDRSRTRVPDFEFKHDAQAHSGQANTKNYFHDTYGIPAITYELGDETNRAAIYSSTPVFAEEMMRTLLEVE